MPKYSVTRRVPYTAQELYAIAFDVPAYAKFVPLVKSATTWNRAERADGCYEFDAKLEIVYTKLRIHEFFVSHVTADPANNIVVTESKDGPFKFLKARWKITDLGDGTADVEYNCDYELKSKMMQLVVSGMLDMGVRKLVSAFEGRANKLYGVRTLPA